MARIRVLNGPGKGTVCEIGDAPLRMGRDSSSTMQVLDRGASRKHAEIFRVGEMCFIRDLNSRNGTVVNDEQISDELLRDGDKIVIGSTTMVFEDGKSGSGVTHGMVEFTEQTGIEDGSSVELSMDDLYLEVEAEEETAPANFKAVYRLGRILMEETDQSHMLDKVVNYIAKLIPSDNIFVFTKDDSGETLIPRAHFTRDKESEHVRVSRTIVQRSIDQMRSILTTDAMTDARFKTEESIVINRIRSVICVPLAMGKRAFGAVYLDSVISGTPFAEEDLELMTVIGTQLSLALENLAAAKHQRDTFLSAIRTLVSLYERRSPTERGHADRISTTAAAIAQKLGLDRRGIASAHLAGLLHDIGKVGSKKQKASQGDPGAPENVEHVLVGEQVAKNIVGAEDIAPAIRHHHERFDGSGFPDHLAGKEIPQLAHVVAVADYFDHLTHAMKDTEESVPPKKAVEAVRQLSGKAFDGEIVRALVQAFEAGDLFDRGSKVLRPISSKSSGLG